jgi:hypothetical protein
VTHVLECHLRTSGITVVPMPYDAKVLSAACTSGGTAGRPQVRLFFEADPNHQVVKFQFQVVYTGAAVTELPGHLRRYVGTTQVPGSSSYLHVYAMVPESELG